ncbi:T9SS type A sorting domain-containing protein [Lacibacter sediminis]|uniref:T9SS type A sorting domain-containing protein n=1 Tax=Lacibacter sediminis TaxID=2760713 RepID=A0A7G5XJY6_9BACT|nr:T9SS type A sorting domain-containing protein [Lacibacter sediminis]QNA45789.1 T9SS type A sorting domain-containing protein [Lacibacter sediminis]
MKKFLQILALLVSIQFTNKVTAQCTVTNVVIDNLTYSPGVGGTNITMDVTFTATTNGGNKLVFFHVWKELQYPQAQMHPSPFNCTGNQAAAPAPVRISGGNTEVDVLDDAFLNYGFNINAVSSTDFSTAGIITSYTDYDNTVILDFAGSTIKKTNINSNNDQISINNLSFFIPDYDYQVEPFIQVRAFNWSTNGTGGKPQCWGCGQTFTIGDPIISGSISCAQPGGATQPKYNLFIDSKYDDPNVAGIQTISGNYSLYVDVNTNGMLEEGTDLLVKSSTNFTTSLEDPNTPETEIPFGFNSRFAGIDLSFDYVFSNGDLNSSKPVLVKVVVTTTGYLGAGTGGNLSNNCGVLPVSFKSFNATQRSGKAFLTWETDQENNNDGFEVERRSAGNSQYQKIGFVDSKAPGGTGSAFSYSFDDNQALAKGVTYYRLRQVDLDGRATYSEVKAVRTGNGGLLTISIYPNPNRGTANVTIPETSGKMDVSLDDYTGKSVQRWSGISVRNLQLNNMRPGIYMLRINFRETGETITERIIVQ